MSSQKIFYIWYVLDLDRCFWSTQSQCLHHRKTLGFLFVTFLILCLLLTSSQSFPESSANRPHLMLAQPPQCIDQSITGPMVRNRWKRCIHGLLFEEKSLTPPRCQWLYHGRHRRSPLSKYAAIPNLFCQNTLCLQVWNLLPQFTLNMQNYRNSVY